MRDMCNVSLQIGKELYLVTHRYDVQYNVQVADFKLGYAFVSTIYIR